MKVLVPSDLPPGAADLFPAAVEVVALPLDGAAPDVHDVETVVLDPRYRVRFGELLPAMPSLSLVQTLNAGVDWVPPLPEGVRLCKATGVHDGPVAEWVLAVTLAMQKRLPWFGSEQAAGRWDASANLAFGDGPAARDLAGSTAVVIGYGSIGRAVGDRLRPFGVEVIGVARTPDPGVHGPEELPRLLPRADIVVLLVPATPLTAGMVDREFLAAMRPGALLVNGARGSLVDTDALVDALHAGTVRAALDATDPEPLPAGHPLWSAPGVLITPHVAGSSAHWRDRAWRFAAEQVRRTLDGEPLVIDWRDERVV